MSTLQQDEQIQVSLIRVTAISIRFGHVLKKGMTSSIAIQSRRYIFPTKHRLIALRKQIQKVLGNTIAMYDEGLPEMLLGY